LVDLGRIVVDLKERGEKALRAETLEEHIGILFGCVIVRPIRELVRKDGSLRRREFFCARTDGDFKVVQLYDKNGRFKEAYDTEWR